MAEYILGQAAIVAKGAYANETAYLPLNSVSYCGGSWICKRIVPALRRGQAPDGKSIG